MTIPFRIGEGWDTHQLVEGRPLILGGITIPHTHGLLGHSDADALCHAITDALFGAASLGFCATIVESMLTGSQPASRTRRTHSASSAMESAPLKAASVSGKWRPMSPRPAAPNSASVMAWHSASASE